MKITEIRGYHLQCAMPEVMRNSVMTLASRAALLVEVVTDSGHSGWGESAHSPAPVFAVIESMLAARVLGEDPAASGRIWNSMMAARRGSGVFMMAVSALDMAIWDLNGRIAGKPVSELLGGRLRDRVTAYASGPYMKPGEDPYRDYVKDTETYLAANFRAVKARSGYTPARDAEMVASLRETIGPDRALMVDINQGYAPAAAIDAIRRIDDMGLLWVEEPVAPEDIAGYRRIAGLFRTPIAGGESLALIEDYRAFLEAGAMAIIQPDLYLCGGFTGAMRIAALAAAYQTPFLPHSWGSLVNFQASLQLAAVLPAQRIGENLAYPFFEYDRSWNALRTLNGEPALNADGTLTVPDAPGIGVELDAERLAPYLKKAWTVKL